MSLPREESGLGESELPTMKGKNLELRTRNVGCDLVRFYTLNYVE